LTLRRNPKAGKINKREMEDLIAAHVEDFFPRRLFELKGRQGTFAGLGRFDLLFEDQFQNNILMELKAAPNVYRAGTIVPGRGGASRQPSTMST
jgi:hypothetical protein